MAVLEVPPPPSPLPDIRSRSSVHKSVVTPTKLIYPSMFSPRITNGYGFVSTPTLAFELASFKSSLSYISLKDILPSSTAVNSPTRVSSASRNLSIRNRLVQQAAWAYLQPMSSSRDSSSQHFLLRLWLQLSARKPINSCIRFVTLHVIPSITGAFDRIRRSIWFPMDR